MLTLNKSSVLNFNKSVLRSSTLHILHEPIIIEIYDSYLNHDNPYNVYIVYIVTEAR